MGIAFDAPLALLLLVPALGLTIALHLASRRRLGAGRRRVALAASGRCSSRRSSSRSPGFQLVLPVDRLATVFVVDLSDSVGNAGREDAARLPARDARREARRRRRRDRRVRQGGAGRAAAVRAGGDRPDRLDAGQVGDRHRRRPAPGDRALPGRRAEADRAAVRRQRHDRRRPGGGGARRVARASRSRRAGSARATSTRSSSSG